MHKSHGRNGWYATVSNTANDSLHLQPSWFKTNGMYICKGETPDRMMMRKLRKMLCGKSKPNPDVTCRNCRGCAYGIEFINRLDGFSIEPSEEMYDPIDRVRIIQAQEDLDMIRAMDGRAPQRKLTASQIREKQRQENHIRVINKWSDVINSDDPIKTMMDNYGYDTRTKARNKIRQVIRQYGFELKCDRSRVTAYMDQLDAEWEDLKKHTDRERWLRILSQDDPVQYLIDTEGRERYAAEQTYRRALRLQRDGRLE